METFCCDLAEGLHAVAQPLTILRNELTLERIKRLPDSELRHSALSSAAEIERACGLFSILSQIVSLERFHGLQESVRTADLIADVLDGVEKLYDERGIHLNVLAGTDPSKVIVQKKRALQSLSIILLSAVALSRSGETVEIQTAEIPGFVDIRILNRAVSRSILDAQSQLVMTLVAAILRKQDGRFIYTLEPLNFQLRFRKASAQKGACLK